MTTATPVQHNSAEMALRFKAIEAGLPARILNTYTVEQVLDFLELNARGRVWLP